MFLEDFFFRHCLYMPEASLGLGLILKRSKVSMFNSQLISVRSVFFGLLRSSLPTLSPLSPLSSLSTLAHSLPFGACFCTSGLLSLSDLRIGQPLDPHRKLIRSGFCWSQLFSTVISRSENLDFHGFFKVQIHLMIPTGASCPKHHRFMYIDIWYSLCDLKEVKLICAFTALSERKRGGGQTLKFHQKDCFSDIFHQLVLIGSLLRRGETYSDPPSEYIAPHTLPWLHEYEWMKVTQCCQ